MKVLITGSRHFDDWKLFTETMYKQGFVGEDKLSNLVIIEGGAKGADFLARVWSKWLGVRFEEYPADWSLGKKAGPIRNAKMLEEGKPDMVIAFLAPDSRGTQNMIDLAEKAGIPTIVVKIPLGLN